MVDKPKGIDVAKSGEIKESDWQLWMCAHETGTDFLDEWGPESEMRESMAREASHGRDVWLISPDGSKVLPNGEATDAELDALRHVPISDEQAERMIENVFSPEHRASQIELGKGHAIIAGFIDSDGCGIMLRHPEMIRPTGEQSGLHSPQPGEVYIKCTNRASALVLMEHVAWVVSRFHGVD